MNISFGFDPIAFLTSLFAVWFAYTESKKNNRILVKITRCKTVEKDCKDSPHAGMITEYSVLIRNLGIAIHDPELLLNFRDKAGFGWINVPLKRRDERTGEHSEFARGMIAEFSLRSHEVDPTFRQILGDLSDLVKQDTRLTLYSQGYIAKVFYVGRWRDRIAIWWNSIAYMFNRKFDRNVTEHGFHMVHMANIVKEDITELSTPLCFFISQVKQRSNQ